MGATTTTAKLAYEAHRSEPRQRVLCSANGEAELAAQGRIGTSGVVVDVGERDLFTDGQIGNAGDDGDLSY